MIWKQIFQNGGAPPNEPWQEPGDPMPIGQGTITPVPFSGPGTSCIAGTMVNSKQMHPIHAVPAGEEMNHRLAISGAYSYPNYCDTDEQWSSTHVRFVRGQDIKPVTIIGKDGAGNYLAPPFAITGLYNTVYSLSGDYPYLDRHGDVVWPCGSENLSQQGRWVLPILRIVSWPGWWIRLRIQGTIPHCIEHRRSFPPHTLTIANMRLGVMGTAGGAIAITDINDSAGGTLWSFASENYCLMQSVSFYLWIPVVACDQLVALWLAAIEDDEFYGGYPANVQRLIHGAFSWTISEPQLWGAAP